MLQSQIEIVSPVFDEVDSAYAEMARLRNGVADVAAEHGLSLLAAGTHPLSAWHLQATTEKPRYARLIDDFQIIGRRNLLCGLHIHVAPPEGTDRVILMNRLMRWIPVFLALSTSSPFWNRQHTGLLSYRQAAYDEWPRTGIPDFFDDEAAYQAFVDLLVSAGSMDGAGALWWAIRPAERFPTLELRIADCCTHLSDAIALAALFRCLVRAHVRRPDIGSPPTPVTRRLIDENRWRAKRYGIDAEFIDEAVGANVPFRVLLQRLRELVAEDAEALRCESALAHLDVILARGTSAHEQIGLYRARRDEGATRIDALCGVVDWLIGVSVPPVSTAFFH